MTDIEVCTLFVKTRTKGFFFSDGKKFQKTYFCLLLSCNFARESKTFFFFKYMPHNNSGTQLNTVHS